MIGAKWCSQWLSKRTPRKDDHLVVAFGLLEGLLQDFERVLPVSSKEFVQCAHDARGRFFQAVAVRVLADPADHGPICRLHLRAARPSRPDPLGIDSR